MQKTGRRGEGRGRGRAQTPALQFAAADVLFPGLRHLVEWMTGWLGFWGGLGRERGG